MAETEDSVSVVVPKKDAMLKARNYLASVSNANSRKAWAAGLFQELLEADLFKGKKGKVVITLHSGSPEAFKQFFGIS